MEASRSAGSWRSLRRPTTTLRAKRADPDLRSSRSLRDEALCAEIHRIWEENFGVYCARKVWRQLVREAYRVVRRTVERLMRRLGLAGIVRGKCTRTMVSDKAQQCPQDKVNRKFRAERSNPLWIADFTCVSTWRGFVYVAFVIDVYARRIIGWKVSRSARTEFALDALEQSFWARKQTKGGLTHYSDRGVQHVSIRYSERLAEAGIESSVGSVGDSYDNAMAESIIGLFKTEVIERQSWPDVEGVEMATLNWQYWYNHKRLLRPIEYVPPVKAEGAHQGESIDPARLGICAFGTALRLMRAS